MIVVSRSVTAYDGRRISLWLVGSIGRLGEGELIKRCRGEGKGLGDSVGGRGHCDERGKSGGGHLKVAVLNGIGTLEARTTTKGGAAAVVEGDK